MTIQLLPTKKYFGPLANIEFTHITWFKIVFVKSSYIPTNILHFNAERRTKNILAMRNGERSTKNILALSSSRLVTSCEFPLFK